MREMFRPYFYPEAELGSQIDSMEKVPNPEKEPDPSTEFEKPVRTLKPLKTIEWSDGSRLDVAKLPTTVTIAPNFQNPSTLVSPTYSLIYTHPDGTTLDLNSILDNAQTQGEHHTLHFIGADSFYAYDSNPRRSGKDRETIIASDPDELQRDKRNLFATFHEIGHAYLFEGSEDNLEHVLSLQHLPYINGQPIGVPPQKERGAIPHLKNIVRWYDFLQDELLTTTDPKTQELDTKIISLVRESLIPQKSRREYLHDVEMASPAFAQMLKVFQERMAWAYAMKVVKRNHIDLGFASEAEKRVYYEYCLSTYGEASSDPRFEHGPDAVRKEIQYQKPPERVQKERKRVFFRGHEERFATPPSE